MTDEMRKALDELLETMSVKQIELLQKYIHLDHLENLSIIRKELSK